MIYEDIRYRLDEGIAHIELHRPERRNAYSSDMGHELVHALRAAMTDQAVRVVILSGAGKGFCAGADREYLAGKPGRYGIPLGEEPFINEFTLELAASPKPLVAAMGGAAVGIGVTMVLPFDLRIAATDASFGFPFTRLGLVPGLGSTHLLTQLVGQAKAREWVLCGATLNAQEALAAGLVNQVVPSEQLMAEAEKWAHRMLESPPEAIAAAKRALTYGASASLSDALANEKLENRQLAPVRAQQLAARVAKAHVKV